MKIIITGPESSGKTTLSIALSRQLNFPLVEEYARNYLAGLTRPYLESDLIHIARKQIEELDHLEGQNAVYDTDLLTTIIWYEEKYGNPPAWMIENWRIHRNSFYLLCTPDVPWEFDIQRENPHDRMRIFEIYHDYLTTYQKKFFVISDDFNIRLNNALNVINVKSKI